MQAQKQDKITKQNDMQKWERIIKHCKHENKREQLNNLKENNIITKIKNRKKYPMLKWLLLEKF